MSSEQLAAIAGIVLSLVFSYIPGLSDWYGALESTRKRLIMAGVLIIVAIGVFAASCGGIWATVTCDKSGAMGLVNALIAALVANQAVYQISPKKSAAS